MEGLTVVNLDQTMIPYVAVSLDMKRVGLYPKGVCFCLRRYRGLNFQSCHPRHVLITNDLGLVLDYRFRALNAVVEAMTDRLHVQSF